MPQTPDLPMRKYDADLVERLQRIHKTGNGNREQKKTGERRNQLFEQLQITDEEFLASYEFIRDALRKEVAVLLNSLKGNTENLRTIESKFIDSVEEQLRQEHSPLYVAELKKYYALLAREIEAQGNNAEDIKRGTHSAEYEQLRQRHLLAMRDIELGLQLQAFNAEKPKKVEEVLTEHVSERATSAQTLMEIRRKVSASLQDVMQKKHENALDDPVTTMDAFYEEIDMEKRSEQEQQLPQQVLNMFGRGGNKKPCYTEDELMSIRGQFGKRITKDRMAWALGLLRSQKKIAVLPGHGGTEIILCRDPSHLTYTREELENVLDPSVYDRLGQFMYMGIATSPQQKIDTTYLEENDAILGIPSEIAEQMMQSFLKRGVLKETASKYSLNKKILQTTGLRPGWELMQVMDGVEKITKDAMAHGQESAEGLIDNTSVEKETTGGKFLERIAKRYREYREKRTVKKLEFDFQDKEDIRLMDLSNIQFGHAMLDVEFLQEMKERINTLPPDHIPDVIVVDGVLYGNYQFQKKKRQRLKVAPTSEQYDAAAELFNWLEYLQQKHGTKLICNMSDEDEHLVEHYAVDTTMRIAQLERERARAAASSGEEMEIGLTPYWRVEQIKQSSLYMHNFDLQWDVALPYSVVTGHQLTANEYDLLIDTYKKLVRGETPSDHAQEVLEIDKIPLPGKKIEDQDLIFTDDFEALCKRAGKRPLVIRGTQSMRATRSSMVQDPMGALRAVIGHKQSQRKIRKRINKEPRPDENPPDAWAVYDQNVFSAENIGGEHGVLAYSTGTLRRGQMDLSSYSRGVQDDNMWRALLNRKDCVTPTVTTIGFGADGSRYYDIYNETFNALSETSESPKRTAVVNISDWQVGSITCAADYLVKMLTMALHTLTRTHDEVIILLNGDLFHGHNYKMAAQEGNPFGMPFPRDQQVFVSDLLENILSKVPRKLKQKIKVVHITDGNHEWNSGEAYYGNSYLHPVELIFRHHSDNTYDTLYHKYGFERGRNGIVMKGSMMTEKAGGFNVWMRHYLLERGMKGSGSNPALQGRTLFPSQGNQMENVDIVPYSHFHNMRLLSVGDKIVKGNPCVAYPSYYESMRAYFSQIGFTYTSVGGGKPVRITEVTAAALDNYNIPDEAFYSEKNLEREGYYTDKDWDPMNDSLANTMIPIEIRKTHDQLVSMGASRVMGKTSALQKRIADQMHAVMTNLQGMGLPNS
ncbi:hypothetical protein COU77_02095 [Candidatus Peregrinibacteria bacterium CG10_big_fil_rev_8_21_14_0_10_49_16]|nr:MAG: hypothetical protein COU77_02095 [Candidatus Peregrinibacteria bacterium CG10_big_fil_rev_8_21_14_0_10_49_16]